MGRHLLLIKLRDGPASSTLINREQDIGFCSQRRAVLIFF